jgi:tRNA threonylcarbamoyladenosine dehydratase
MLATYSPAGLGAPRSAAQKTGPDRKMSDEENSEARPFRLHRRFDRIARLVGEAGMRRLADARVIVFGLGGVGSYAVEGLVRSGVGHLTLVDFDVVCVTNTNRQLHAVHGAVGRPKAELMAERCRAINPEVDVRPVTEFYREETSAQLLGGSWDFVVDAVDNIKAKLHLLATCVGRGLKVASSMGAAGRLDPTYLRVGDLCETHMDQFAKDIRKLLRRKYGIDANRPTGITAVFSIEPRRESRPLSWDDPIGGFTCVCPQGDNPFHSCEHRSQIDGSAVFVTSVFGMHLAGVVVRRIAQGR